MWYVPFFSAVLYNRITWSKFLPAVCCYVLLLFFFSFFLKDIDILKSSQIARFETFNAISRPRKTRARSIAYTEQYNEIGPKFSSSPVYTDYGSFSNPTSGTWIQRSQRHIPLDMEEIYENFIWLLFDYLKRKYVRNRESYS